MLLVPKTMQADLVSGIDAFAQPAHRFGGPFERFAVKAGHDQQSNSAHAAVTQALAQHPHRREMPRRYVVNGGKETSHAG
jgi:hypothetical protein